MCMPVAAEWINTFSTGDLLLTSADFVDTFFRLTLSSLEMYVVGCDAVAAVLNSGHSGLEYDGY